MAKTPEQIERDKARNAAIRNAKETVRKFFADKLFSKLAEDVQDALRVLAPVARQATSTVAVEIKALFADKSVLSELDIFKALKVGPNEMRAKVNHCLKLAQPDDRMWIDYDEAECTWTLHSTGAEMPDGFNVATLIPTIADRVGQDNFATMTINQMIDAEKAATATEGSEE